MTTSASLEVGVMNDGRGSNDSKRLAISGKRIFCFGMLLFSLSGIAESQNSIVKSVTGKQIPVDQLIEELREPGRPLGDSLDWLIEIPKNEWASIDRRVPICAFNWSPDLSVKYAPFEDLDKRFLSRLKLFEFKLCLKKVFVEAERYYPETLFFKNLGAVEGKILADADNCKLLNAMTFEIFVRVYLIAGRQQLLAYLGRECSSLNQQISDATKDWLERVYVMHKYLLSVLKTHQTVSQYLDYEELLVKRRSVGTDEIIGNSK
jgi:hypothetical protein